MGNAPAIRIGGIDGRTFSLDPAMANRHGMIAGATGTGKTVSLQVLAEGFSRAGVPVFLADVKGDLSGLSAAGKPHREIDRRIKVANIQGYQARGYPVAFWDIFGERGHPVRATVSDMGPLLLSSLLELNDTQSGVLYAMFRIADDHGMLLLDMKDMKAMLGWMSEHSTGLGSEYGSIPKPSINAIMRRLLVLEEQGADRFFGEPALDIRDLMRCGFSGIGLINVLDAARLHRDSPRLYAAFLLWLLAEFFEQLPEAGDLDRPKLVLFFDEAHLLFDNAPAPLLEKIEQVVRLIRSKGVGVYFISQSPLDIPEEVLGQLGLRIQHALRAFTPKDRKAVRAVAANFRPNPKLNTATVITELGIGEALVSVLDADGAPTPVERVLIAPPESQIGPVSGAERAQRIASSPFAGRYDQEIDRESAYEALARRAQAEAAQHRVEAEETWSRPSGRPARAPRSRGSSRRQSLAEAMMKSFGRSVASSIGRKLARGLLGSLLGRR